MTMIPTAEAGLFDIFNETYISDISELPFTNGTSDIKWQESGHIRAWVDIVGFRNLSRDGDNFSILGDPASLAIVQYDAIGLQYGYLDRLEKTISFNQSGNNLTALLHVVLKWHTESCDDNGCWISGRFTEEEDFRDNESIPEQYNKFLNPIVNITEYDNEIEPKISIQVIDKNASSISISYGNKSLTHTSKSYHVETTYKGIYYANTSDIEAWNIQGRGIARFGNSIIINSNISEIDYSQLDIRVSNLYDSLRVNSSNFNITRVNYQPATVLYNPVLYGFLGVFFTLTGSAYYLIRQVIL